ncbi:MAG: PLP-dependent aminotransferase family protein [Planctomycetota bacterium]
MTDSDWLFARSLDRRRKEALHRQLYRAIHDAILDGVLAPGARLPSTRSFAEDLGVSRNTVLQAVEQLIAEGFLQGRSGSGTFVAQTLPGNLSKARPRQVGGAPRRGRRLSERGKRLMRLPVHWGGEPVPARPFMPGVPALEKIPRRILTRLVTRQAALSRAEEWSYGSSLGALDLREAVSRYLARARGVQCDPSRILIVEGSQQGLDLIARVLLDPGDRVWVEDPGYRGARHAFFAAGADVDPRPVDNEGMMLPSNEPASPRLIYVTPSNQFPLGGALSAGRRLELLAMAQRHRAWIVEDDYDSEFRYSGAPLPALSQLDHDERVLYLGTFSKTIAPSLRLGFLVLPEDLVEPFAKARVVTGEHAPTFWQGVLAAFLEEGHFARHVRRMRKLYASRLEVLVEAAEKELCDWITLGHHEAGLHVVGWLREGLDDRAVSEAASQRGLVTYPVSMFRMRPKGRPGLLLGYACLDEAAIRRGARELRAVLEAM